MAIVASVTLEKTQQQQETHKLISVSLGYIHVYIHNIITLMYEKQQHETATSQGWGYNTKNATLNKSGWRDTYA